jgi:Domain of unknown function (DUF929).
MKKKSNLRGKKVKNRTEWKKGMILTAIIAIILAAYVIIVQSENSSQPIQDEKVIGDFTLVSNSILSEYGKIVILFIGAEACPFCAAESWSIVSALSQYGTWNGLSPIISNATDSIPKVPGYTFANATLESSQVSFVEVELTTTSWDQKLQSLNSSESQLYKEYDPNGLIPFLLIGGMYLHIGSAVSPYLISNMDWDQCYNLSKSKNAFHDQVINESSNISQVINYVIDKYSSSSEAFRVSTCLAPEFLLGDISRLK